MSEVKPIRTELTDRERQALSNAAESENLLKAASDLTLQAMNEMINDEESIIFKKEDIYPEIWDVILQNVVAVINDANVKMLKKTKDVLRVLKTNELSQPRVNPEDRETPPEDLDERSLFVDSNVFNMRDQVDELGDNPKAIINKVIENLKEVDEMNVYSNTSEDVFKALVSTEDKAYSLIKYVDQGFITRNEFNEFTDAFCGEAGGNTFIAIDVIFNIFECPRDIAILIPRIKYDGFIQQVIAERENNKPVETEEGSDESAEAAEE